MIQRNVSQKFAALGDETRTEIVELLRMNGELRLSEIAEQFSASRQSITKHIDILQNAEIVQTKKLGRERLTSLSPKAFDSIAQWMSHYEEFWDRKLNKLARTIAKRIN